ncbi:MAG TPA: PaaI family thioesterase [Burkholderiaceae bacterium]|nr:PaaI family thioesterase [Burkholderiaceae bacterium]
MKRQGHAVPDDVAATIARWEDDEARVRQRLAPPGLVGHDELVARTGLQMFESIGNGELPSVPIGASLDFIPIEFGPGRMVFQGRPSERFANPMGTIHGGWIATLLDSAVACAVHTTLAAGKAYTTAELKVSYVRALSPKVPLVRAEGTVISSGRQLGFAEGRLYGPDGTLYAHATTTCVVLAPRG